jgi:hypothetical protein
VIVPQGMTRPGWPLPGRAADHRIATPRTKTAPRRASIHRSCQACRRVYDRA